MHVELVFQLLAIQISGVFRMSIEFVNANFLMKFLSPNVCLTPLTPSTPWTPMCLPSRVLWWKLLRTKPGATAKPTRTLRAVTVVVIATTTIPVAVFKTNIAGHTVTLLRLAIAPPLEVVVLASRTRPIARHPALVVSWPASAKIESPNLVLRNRFVKGVGPCPF